MKISKAYFEQIIKEECEAVLLEKKSKRGVKRPGGTRTLAVKREKKKKLNLDDVTRQAWEKLKAEFPPGTLVVQSARRTEGGTPKSAHRAGKALDVRIPPDHRGREGMDWRRHFIGAAQRAGFTSFGLGRFIIHIDTRDSRAWWTYDDAAKEINRSTRPNKFDEMFSDRVPEEFRSKSNPFLGLAGLEVKRDVNRPPYLGSLPPWDEEESWLSEVSEAFWTEYIWDNVRGMANVLWEHLKKHPKGEEEPEPQLVRWEGFFHRLNSLVDDFLYNEPEEHVLFGREPVDIRGEILKGILLEDPLTGAEMSIEESLHTNMEEIRRQIHAASDEAYAGVPDFYSLRHIVSEWINKVWANPVDEDVHLLRDCSRECTEKFRKENPELSDVGFARQEGLRQKISRCTRDCMDLKKAEDEEADQYRWYEPEEDPPTREVEDFEFRDRSHPQPERHMIKPVDPGDDAL